MRVLVSGATGFIGRSITSHLLLGGHTVRAMSRSAKKAKDTLASRPGVQMALEEGRLTFVAADVTEPASLGAAVGDVDVVIQCAQFPGAPVEDAKRGLTYEKVDRDGTLNLLSAVAAEYGARTAGPGMTRFPEGAPRFLYQSGVTVSADAVEYWDRAKWQAEEAICGSGLEWAIVRSSWVFGPGDVALNRIIGYSDVLPFVPIFGNGKELLTPLYVEDVGRLFTRLVGDPEASRDATLPLGGPNRHDHERLPAPSARRDGTAPADPAHTQTRRQDPGHSAPVPAGTTPVPRGRGLLVPRRGRRPVGPQGAIPRFRAHTYPRGFGDLPGVAIWFVTMGMCRVRTGRRGALSAPRLAGMATARAPRPDLDPVVAQKQVGLAS